MAESSPNIEQKLASPPLTPAAIPQLHGYTNNSDKTRKAGQGSSWLGNKVDCGACEATNRLACPIRMRRSLLSSSSSLQFSSGGISQAIGWCMETQGFARLLPQRTVSGRSFGCPSSILETDSHQWREDCYRAALSPKPVVRP